MKNRRILLSIGLWGMVGSSVAVPCLRVNPWLCDFEEILEGFEQRHEATLQYMAQIAEVGQQDNGGYKAASINIALHQTEVGLEAVIPVPDVESSKISVEYLPGNKQQDDTVFVHIPVQHGILELRFGHHLMQVEQKVEQKSDNDDARYWAASQSRYGRSLPVHIDPRSVDVVLDKATETLRLVFRAKKDQQQRKIKINVKGLHDEGLVKTEEAPDLAEKHEGFDLK